MAALVVGVTALVGWMWHFGQLRPSPDCCGEGGAGPSLGLSDEPGAVTITARFFNTSPQAIDIVGVDADLPGATVLGVAPYPEPFAWEMPPEQLAVLPHRVEANDQALLAITFRPDSCQDGALPWGQVELDLEVADDRWHPTFGRRYTLPEPVVEATHEIMFLPPEHVDMADLTRADGPLGASCVLLEG